MTPGGISRYCNPQQMRVLQIASASSIGGGNRSLLHLNRILRDRTTSLRVVIPGTGPMADACASEKIVHECASWSYPSWRRPDVTWMEYRRWRLRLHDLAPDVLHANDPLTARSVALPAWRCSVPLVCHVRFPMEREAIEWVFRRLPKPAAIIFNSHALRAECGENFERTCPQSKHFVIHNGVDLRQFQPRPKQSKNARVGILANLTPVKGHRDFLQMARILTNQSIDAEYYIIGEDIQGCGTRTDTEELSKELNLCDRVHFLGHRSDLPELLNELDVVVCASHVEPFGRSLIEAMACEKPVVATRVGGIPEIVDEGVTGFLVPPAAPNRLADAVAQLLNDPQLSARMGCAGRQRVEKCFSIDTHADAVLEVYQSVQDGVRR